jgi:hypothetical protein
MLGLVMPFYLLSCTYRFGVGLCDNMQQHATTIQFASEYPVISVVIVVGKFPIDSSKPPCVWCSTHSLVLNLPLFFPENTHMSHETYPYPLPLCWLINNYPYLSL